MMLSHLLELLLFPALELLPEVVAPFLVRALVILVIACRALPILLGRFALRGRVLSQVCPGAGILQPHLLRRQGQRQPC